MPLSDTPAIEHVDIIEHSTKIQHMVQLPPELLDAVFTELDSYKKQDLRSCSLVCHVWSALSRPHLFRQVTYTLRDNSKCPETISNLRAAFRNILTFFEEHPEFAIYTQELNLKTIPVLNRHEWLIPPDAGYHDPAAFLSLLGLFSRLEHLRIQDVFVTSSPSAQIDCKLISLKSLAIESVQEEIPPSDVIHLLNCFKEIGSLDIAVFCYYSYRRVEDNYPTSRHLAVHSLVTRGSTSGGLFLHIVQTPSARVLHTLSLGNLETSFFPGLQELLTVTRSSLAYLRLSFCGFWQDERADGPPIITLACCSTLQSLELSVRAQPLDWQAIWHVVATISADSNRALEDMTLVLRERQFLVAEDVWRLISPSVLSSTYATLSWLKDRGRFRRFILQEVAEGDWRNKIEVFPDLLQGYARS